MTHMDPSALSPRAKNFFQMIEFDSNEELIGEIRKHPFGLFIIFFTGGLVALALMISLMVVPLLITEDPVGKLEQRATDGSFSFTCFVIISHRIKTSSPALHFCVKQLPLLVSWS